MTKIRTPAKLAEAVNASRKVVDLKPAEYNPRKITPAELESIAKSMAEFGDLSGIVFNSRTGRVVGGHQRIKVLNPDWIVNAKAATEKVDLEAGTVASGWIETPWGRLHYREVSWGERKEKAANIAANKHGGDWDIPRLKEMLVELDDGAFDLRLTGFSDRELQSLIDWNPQGGGQTDPDEVPEPPKIPMTKPGDLWLLGDHRVLCADATMPADVQTTMFGDRAAMMWTDPPYGVDYVGKTKRELKIKNDSSDGLLDLLTRAFAASKEALVPGAAIYVAHPPGARQYDFLTAFLEQGWRLHQSLVWVKDSMVLGHSDYHYRHEPLLFGYAAGPGRRGRGGEGWYGGHNATSVFEVPRPKASEDHPTKKPVDLILPMLQNSSKPGDIVYDPFAGSGSTLIAAESLGRRCYALEIEPAYCDVIAERWQNFTGKNATRKNLTP